MPAIRRLQPSATIAVALGLVGAAAYAIDALLVDYFGAFIVVTYLGGSFAGVGLILALSRPGHPVGWLFLIAGACMAVADTSRAYAWRALVQTPGALPNGEVALWLSRLMAPPGAAAFGFAAALFPTGRLLSPRWVPFLVAGIAVTAGQTLTWGFAPTPIHVPYALSAPPSGGIDTLPTVPNPAAIGGSLGAMLASLTLAINGAVGPLFLVTLITILLRFVRSSGVERLQMKWFVYAASLSIGSVLVATALPFTSLVSGVAWVLSVVFRALVPIAVGIAILRYRLYDIDLLINRTVVYGATTAAIGATFFLGLVALQSVLRPITNGSDLAVAAATLLSFALFQPVRRGIQAAVDRRFDRSRYDAARTLDGFAERLRDEVNLDEVRADLIASVQQTMAPTHTSLWLREAAR